MGGAPPRAARLGRLGSRDRRPPGDGPLDRAGRSGVVVGVRGKVGGGAALAPRASELVARVSRAAVTGAAVAGARVPSAAVAGASEPVGPQLDRRPAEHAGPVVSRAAGGRQLALGHGAAGDPDNRGSDSDSAPIERSNHGFSLATAPAMALGPAG